MDWPTVLEAWRITWSVLDGIAVLGGVAAAVEVVRRRLRRGRDAVARHFPRWGQRHAGPHDVLELLAARQWDVDELATRLGCPREDAEAVLEAFGFVDANGDGLWEQEGDDGARALRAVFDQLQYSYAASLRQDFMSVFRERAEELLRTGEAPPEEELPLEEEVPPVFEFVSLTLTVEGAVCYGRFGDREVQISMPYSEAEGLDELLVRARSVVLREAVRLGAEIGESEPQA